MIKKVIKWIVIVLAVLLLTVYLISIPLVRDYISDALFVRVQNEVAYELIMKHEGIEKIEIDTSVGTCGGFRYQGDNPHNTTVVYFYGATQCAEEVMLVGEGICNPSGTEKCNLVILDYSGNGRSTGTYDEKNMKKMLLEAYDILLEQEYMKNQRIVLYGYSLGTGLVNYVASQREVDGIVLIAPYCNGYDLYNGLVNIFHGIFKVYVPFKMNAQHFAKSIDIVPLIISSVDDEMVPHDSSVRLAQSYPNGAQFYALEGLAHSEYGTDEVFELVSDYLHTIWEE